MIVATNCPNCKQDQPVEIKEQRFELYTKDTDKGFLPVSCTKCGATWELHYKLAGEENLELDED
jgi:ribosomal protein L44E